MWKKEKREIKREVNRKNIQDKGRNEKKKGSKRKRRENKEKRGIEGIIGGKENK